MGVGGGGGGGGRKLKLVLHDRNLALNALHSGKNFSADGILKYSQKTGFEISCKLSPQETQFA